jgi:hypothetical protein
MSDTELLQRFAGLAMHALITRDQPVKFGAGTESKQPDAFAEAAVNYAGALLAALKKAQESESGGLGLTWGRDR